MQSRLNTNEEPVEEGMVKIVSEEYNEGIYALNKQERISMQFAMLISLVASFY